MSDIGILIVEDEVVVALEIEEALQSLHYQVVGSVTDGEEALRVIPELMPDLVLMDIRLSGEMDGIETAEKIFERHALPVVYLTAHSDRETLKRAVRTQPYGYLIKPFRERELFTTIEIAYHKHRALQSEISLHKRVKELDCLYGISRLIEDCADLDELLKNAVTCIPAAWQYPQACGARIVVGGKEYTTWNFRTTPWMQEAMICNDGEVMGKVTVCYLKDKPLCGEGPFLLCERSLLNSIAERLGKEIVRMRLEEQKLEACAQLTRNFEQFAILNDQIRNPLAVIVGVASMNESEQMRAIIEQANSINELITQIDRRWLESDKVMKYLKKHHVHN